MAPSVDIRVGEFLSEVWVRVTSIQPAPDQAILLATAAISLLLVGWSTLWPLTRHLVTVAHESGHALLAVLTGRRLLGVRVHADTSGVTLSKGRPTGPGMVLMLAAGYLAPGLAGLGAALLLAAGRGITLLWLIVGWLALLLIQIRNAYGLLVLLLAGGAAALASWYLPAAWLALLACLLTWILLLGGVKAVWELIRQRARTATPGSDVDQLHRLTRLPGSVWSWSFLLLNSVALLAASAALFPQLSALVA